MRARGAEEPSFGTFELVVGRSVEIHDSANARFLIDRDGWEFARLPVGVSTTSVIGAPWTSFEDAFLDRVTGDLVLQLDTTHLVRVGPVVGNG